MVPRYQIDFQKVNDEVGSMNDDVESMNDEVESMSDELESMHDELNCSTDNLYQNAIYCAILNVMHDDVVKAKHLVVDGSKTEIRFLNEKLMQNDVLNKLNLTEICFVTSNSNFGWELVTYSLNGDSTKKYSLIEHQSLMPSHGD